MKTVRSSTLEIRLPCRRVRLAGETLRREGMQVRRRFAESPFPVPAIRPLLAASTFFLTTKLRRHRPADVINLIPVTTNFLFKISLTFCINLHTNVTDFPAVFWVNF